MERTESVVIQVAPSFENVKIKEMEMFGWNLQGRQEIHEEGEAYAKESLLSSGTYAVKTKVSKYVKLHFVRALNMLNLEKIKHIENQYFNLPFPEIPGFKSYLGPLFFVFCAIVSLSDSQGGGSNIGGAIVCLAIGIGWAYFLINKRQKNLAVCMESIKKREELISQLESLS